MMMQLVHLDLKGAPPKISYFKQVFPLFRQWGANGLLVEYEDMFPYVGNLDVISSADAYSASDIFYIQQLAKENGLEYIPLIQTFGHMEFVLKHKKFQHLRENLKYPSALCPSHPESFDLVKSLVQQVMSLHRNINYIHIGCDEVFHLAQCNLCRYRVKKDFYNVDQLFLSHVKNVASYMNQTFPGVKPIIWDDMLRHTRKEILLESGLGGLVEPMMWIYSSNFGYVGTRTLWPKYLDIFGNVWAASAFKGSSGPHTYYSDIPEHIKNHHTWLTEINKYVPYDQFRGYALTGWQRYDHFVITCELLPVALPCLAFCLQTVLHGGFNSDIYLNISASLGFSKLVKFNIIEGKHISKYTIPQNELTSGNYPGHTVYAVAKSLLEFELSMNLKKLNDPAFSNVLSHISDYQIKVGRIGLGKMEEVKKEVTGLLMFFTDLKNNAISALSDVFYQSTVEEWIAVFIDPWYNKFENIHNKATEQLRLLGEPELKELQKDLNKHLIPNTTESTVETVRNTFRYKKVYEKKLIKGTAYSAKIKESPISAGNMKSLAVNSLSQNKNTNKTSNSIIRDASLDSITSSEGNLPDVRIHPRLNTVKPIKRN
ncbi:hexosaminidase D-like [Glandiceps talaboti]